MPDIKLILVPVDFSSNNKKAIAYASGLAKAFGAKLLVVHVIPPSAYPLLNVAGMTHFPNLRDEIKKRCEGEITELKQSIEGSVATTTRVLEGVPFAEILNQADAERADLIVMATHGHTGLKHIVLGSTAERVVRLAKCPVLTLRGEPT